VAFIRKYRLVFVFLGCLGVAVSAYFYMDGRTPYTSQAQQNTVCNERHGAGAAFYKFDKLIIYFPELADGANYVEPDFPELFKRRAFEQHVETVVRETFAPCLTGAGGVTKPVVTTEEWIGEMFDHDNVVLDVRLHYEPHSPNVLSSDYVLLQTFIFRAGLEPRDAFSTATHTKAFEFFLHNKELASSGPLWQTLDRALRAGLQPFQEEPRFKR